MSRSKRRVGATRSRETMTLRGRWSASAFVAAVAGGTVLSSGAAANEDVLAVQNLPDHVVMPGITYNGWNYSPLDQINLANVGDLGLVWTVPFGATDEFEAPP